MLQVVSMARGRAVPVLIGADKVRVDLVRVHLGGGTENESWLQELIHTHPDILPIADIEPGFGEPIAAAREVPCAHGFIDNLYLTPSGEIVLVETKLWRNSQMRREVVAQALSYVAALTGMPFEAFEAAVANGQHAPKKLYNLVAERPDVLGETEFIDAVSLNLMRGRMLVIIVGDGLRTETEALAQLLQSHAGSHFTFALVELATWRNAATGDILAVPTTLAKTVMIERGIVRLEQGLLKVEPMPTDVPSKPQSITSTDFWEAMAKRDPMLPTAIRALLDELEPLGIYSDMKAALNLKADFPEWDKQLNFGYISRNGQFWPNELAYKVPQDVWMPYFETLAKLVGGKVKNEPNSRFVAAADGKGVRIEQFLPKHHDAVVAAIQQVIGQLRTEPTAVPLPNTDVAVPEGPAQPILTHQVALVP